MPPVYISCVAQGQNGSRAELKGRMLDAIRDHHVASGPCASIARIAGWNVDAACVAIVADAIPTAADTLGGGNDS